MAFNKTATFSVNNMSALNSPTGWEIFNVPNQIKTASVTAEAKKEDLGGFDIKEAASEHPDHLFLKIFAIKKDEVNDNGDAFSEDELEKAAHTFVGVPLFTNHQNDDIEKARGECVHAWYDKKAGGIYIIGKVDKIAYPKLARGIEENYITGTSMGCSVEYSCCSICHNRAKTADDYCDHVKNRKNRKFSGDIQCHYHDSEEVRAEDKCPICNSTKKEAKTIHHEDRKIFEHNFGLKFIENSFVVNPACHDCGVKCILNIPEVQKKVASLKDTVNKLVKNASDPDFVEKNIDNLTKIGGVRELESLKNSMSKMEEVVQSMLKQKENVSMEYVSDLVKAMSDVQVIFDELNEMGYGKLPSPPITEANASPVPVSTFPAPYTGNQVNTTPQPMNKSDGGFQAADLSGLGTVTKPKTSSTKIKDFLGVNQNITKKVATLMESVSKLKNRSENMTSSIIEVYADSNDPASRRIIINKKDDDVFITEAEGEQILKIAHISQYPTDMQNLIKNSPEKAGETILNNNLNIGANMAINNTKTAGIKEHDTITEKQLAEAKLQTDKTPTGITESKEQLAGSEQFKDTTSDSPQVRLDNTPEKITEDQLESVKSAELLRLDNTPTVITEKQWNDMSRLVSAKISKDYTSVITEKQLSELLKNHQFAGLDINVITEKQLSDIKMTDGLKRWANKDYSLSVIKMATSTIADAIATFKKSPSELSKAASTISDNYEMKSKASYLAVVNSMPYKSSERELLAHNFAYFTKIASEQPKISAIDALILSAANNAQFGIYAEDVFDAVSHALRNKTTMAKVDSLVKTKLASTTEDSIISKHDAFEAAIKSMGKSEDGKYRIFARVEDINVKPTDKVAFAKGLKKIAQLELAEDTGDEDMPCAVINVKVDKSGNLLIDIQDTSVSEAEDMDADQIGEAMEGPVEDIEFESEENENPFEENEEEESEEHEESETPEFEKAEHEQQTEDPIVDEEEESKPCSCGKQSCACSKTKVNKLAEARKEIIKKAQMMGGQMGGQGGAGQGPGAGATMPMAPGAGAGQAPMESLTDQPNPDDMGDMGGEGESSEPLPPGSICPVCGSQDVDVVSGKGKCNSCSSEMNFKVEVNVTKWKNLTPEGDENNGEEDGLGEGEGFDIPEGNEAAAPAAAGAGADAGMGAGMAAAAKTKFEFKKFAASMRIKPEAAKKLEDAKIAIGSVSPATGTTNTLSLGGNNYVCLDTGTKYSIEYRTEKTDPKNIYAQWSWTPITKDYPKCTSCDRAAKKFAKALSSINMTTSDFDALDITKKAEAIVTMKKAGSMNLIKTAAKESSVLSDLKVAFGGYGDKFPVESCREKLARRFGENALALSGPCEGQPIADCVCEQLKKADVYTDKIAYKIAEVWTESCTGDEQCVTDQIRNGHSIKDAATICVALKLAVAEKIGTTDPEYLLAEEIGQDFGSDQPDPTAPTDGTSTPTETPQTEEVDPFDNPEASDTITIEIPKDVAQQIADKVNSEGGDQVADEVTPVADESALTTETPEAPVNENPEIAPTEGTGEVTETLKPEDLASPVEDTKPCDAGGIGSAVNEIMDDSKKNKGENSGKVVITTNDIQGGAGEATTEGEYDLKEAIAMNSKISASGKISMDLSKVVDTLNKKADKEISHQNAQDAKDIGQISGGDNAGKIGNEEPVKAVKPSVPRDKALIGNEDSNLNPQDKPQPKIPSGKAEIGGEAAAGYTGGADTYTGGDKGQGKTETASMDEELAHMKGFGKSSDSLTRLAERIKAASDKKVEDKKPVSEDSDIKPISNGKAIGGEEKFDAKEVKPTDVKSTGGHIGHEKETIGDKPDSPKDNPSIPSDKALMGGEGEEIAPEKQTNIKGTLIASTESDAESEAYRVAGRMIEAKLIEASKLQSKVNELKQYKPAQIKDIEKSIFAGQKGLDGVSDGMSQPLIVNEASNFKSDSLTQKLTEMFTLGKQNKLADEDPVTQLRKNFGK